MKFKSIEAFVRHSIKADAADTDIVELQRLLDQMSTTEMQQFWMRFVSNRALSAAMTTVPHLKIKEEQICFQKELTGWFFCPKEKDASGKYIVVRKDLEEHVKSRLLSHIRDKRV